MGTCQNIVNRQAFIDDISQSLGTCLRGKCQTAFFDVLHFLHNIKGKGINTKGWQGNIDMFFVTLLNQEIDQFLQIGIIR